MRHKIIWDFEIQTDYLILTRRPDQEIIYKMKKEDVPNSELWRSGGSRSENYSKRNEGHKYLDLVREQKIAMEYESDGDTNRYWCSQNDLPTW